MFDLTGRVAVVTGASRGLGRQDALTLARQGADVVITDVLVEDDPDLQKTAEAQGSMLAQVAVSQGWVHSNSTAEEIRKMGRKSLAIKMDVTNRDQVRDVFKKVREQFGKIDILVNNAATLDHAASIPNQSPCQAPTPPASSRSTTAPTPIIMGERALFFFTGPGAGRGCSAPPSIRRAFATICSIVSTSRLPSTFFSTHCVLASMYLSPPVGSDTSTLIG